MACPPSVSPILASSPVAWTAVVTSSVPLGGATVGSGRLLGEAFLAASSEGEPDRTARGFGDAERAFAAAVPRLAAGRPVALGVARVGLAAGFGRAALAFGFARAAR